MIKNKILSILVIVLLCVFVAACGEESKDTVNNSADSTEASSVATVDTSVTSDVVLEDWGYGERIVTEKNDSLESAYIKFPFANGIMKGPGKIANQGDGTLVLFGCQLEDTSGSEGFKADEIFPTCFEDVEIIFSGYREITYKDFEFEIINKEKLTVNGYEMCKYIGKHTFTVSGTPNSIAFVAYTTNLKSNNAPVYWMVFDQSEDQSLASLIEAHADNMAKTFHE